MAKIIALFEHSQDPTKDTPSSYVSRSQAELMLRRGLAEICGPKALKAKASREIVNSSVHILRGNKQGGVYEIAAIEKHTKIFQGGLNRTETQPSKFQLFKGAKVGHQ